MITRTFGISCRAIDKGVRQSAILLTAAILSGCGSAVYFAGYTRVGIDASVDNVGIGVRQAAVTVSPPKKDGSAHDIVAQTDMDLSLGDVVISQEVAVGDAAKELTALPNSDRSNLRSDEKDPTSLFFGAFTSWSLIEINAGNSASPGIMFGFKRATAVRMPVIDDKIGSAYAQIQINTTPNDVRGVAPSALPGGVRNSYKFATGQPAIDLAKKWGTRLDNSGGGVHAFKDFY